MGNKNRRNSSISTPIRPSQISDLISAATALEISPTSDVSARYAGESPLAVRPAQHPSGQIKPPFTPRWEQVYADDTSEPLVVNTLLLDGAKKHQLNALWEQLDSLKFTNSAEDKKYKTSVIADAKQFFQNALDMYFIGGAGSISTIDAEMRTRDRGAENPEGMERPQRVRLGYFFRTHAKGFMVTFRSDEELWLARDHADEWLQNLFHADCGGYGRRMATGVARLFEVWGGIILKNVQLPEAILKEVWQNRPSLQSPGNANLAGLSTPPSVQAASPRDRPRFDIRYCKEFERNNPMFHSDNGARMQYRVRRMEYLGGARRGHTISVFFHDRDATEYFFCQVGTVTIFEQIIPVIDFYRQSGTVDARWEGQGRALDVDETRNRNVKLAKERTEKLRQDTMRLRASAGTSPRPRLEAGVYPEHAVADEEGMDGSNSPDSRHPGADSYTEYGSESHAASEKTAYEDNASLDLTPTGSRYISPVSNKLAATLHAGFGTPTPAPKSYYGTLASGIHTPPSDTTNTTQPNSYPQVRTAGGPPRYPSYQTQLSGRSVYSTPPEYHPQQGTQVVQNQGPPANFLAGRFEYAHLERELDGRRQQTQTQQSTENSRAEAQWKD